MTVESIEAFFWHIKTSVVKVRVMDFFAWSENRFSREVEKLREAIAAICDVPVGDDGLYANGDPSLAYLRKMKELPPMPAPLAALRLAKGKGDSPPAASCKEALGKESLGTAGPTPSRQGHAETKPSPGSQRMKPFSCARVRPLSEEDYLRSKAPGGENVKTMRSRRSRSKSRGKRKRRDIDTVHAELVKSMQNELLKKANKDRAQRLNSRNISMGLSAMVSKKKGSSEWDRLQLQVGRKRKLRFGRSPIHAWGVFAEEPLQAGDFVVEYVGELIRPIIADKREKIYESQGLPDYMFRIDNECICDATKKGSLARFINHSCDPNCVTQIISHAFSKKIVLYAKRDIQVGEELSYDYKFPLEDDKIPCHCGAKKCRKYLN